jgi:dolichol-phosphate mannosyltransferase
MRPPLQQLSGDARERLHDGAHPSESTPGTARAAPGPLCPPVSLVLPTYNEVQNLPRLIPRLISVLEREGVSFEIIVVDDDSPDGTWVLAGEMALTDRRLRVIRRRGERGLATAVTAGWRAAQGEVLGVMDADLQYPPEGLPELLKAMGEDAGVDVVVASRYAPGARLGAWSPRREIVSRVAILLAKVALPQVLSRLRDPNSGYFLIRRRVIEDVDLHPLGYKILIEVLARGHWQRIVEVPHAYEGRHEGTSKLGFRQTVEFLCHLARLVWDTRVTKRTESGLHRDTPPIRAPRPR